MKTEVVGPERDAAAAWAGRTALRGADDSAPRAGEALLKAPVLVAGYFVTYILVYLTALAVSVVSVARG